MFKFISDILRKSSSVKLLTKKNLRLLEDLIGEKIKNPQYFIEALTHRSALDHKRFKQSNERLEFLGDAVLGFCVAEALFNSFKEKDEGYLTKIRANFVNKNTLYDAAVRINLIHYLFISNELLASANIGIKTILSDALEALIGAVYLDSGLETVRKFIDMYITAPNLKMGLHLVDDNYKSQLLELTQAARLEMPKYEVIKEEGPEHERWFTIQVLVSDEALGVGKGRNKKTAEQEAAKEAFYKLKKRIVPSNGN